MVARGEVLCARARASGAERGFAAIGSRRGVRVDARGAVRSSNRRSPSDGSRVGRRAATRGEGDAEGEGESEGEGARARDANERFREALREEARVVVLVLVVLVLVVRRCGPGRRRDRGRLPRLSHHRPRRGGAALHPPRFLPRLQPDPPRGAPRVVRRPWRRRPRRARGDSRRRPAASSSTGVFAGVLAGTERSDPLDVIARERERMEQTSRTPTSRTTSNDPWNVSLRRREGSEPRTRCSMRCPRTAPAHQERRERDVGRGFARAPRAHALLLRRVVSVDHVARVFRRHGSRVADAGRRRARRVSPSTLRPSTTPPGRRRVDGSMNEWTTVLSVRTKGGESRRGVVGSSRAGSP